MSIAPRGHVSTSVKPNKAMTAAFPVKGKSNGAQHGSRPGNVSKGGPGHLGHAK